METLTKNKQSKDAVRKMTEKYMFPLKMTDCEELTEGMFNAAYEARLSDGSSVILKIAPPKEADILTYEKNIMYAEVQTMKMLSQQGSIPVPNIYGYDDSCTVCTSPYFVMEKLRGESMNKIRYSLSSEQIDSIYLETGRIIRRVNSIVCPRFGYPAQSEFQGNNWYSVFCKMMNAAVFDAKRTDAVLEVSPYELMTELGRSEAFLRKWQSLGWFTTTAGTATYLWKTAISRALLTGKGALGRPAYGAWMPKIQSRPCFPKGIRA